MNKKLFSVLLIAVLIVSAFSTGMAQDGELLGEVPGYESWADVLAAAEGTTVNFFMWGGSDTINSNADADIGDPVLEQYGITLNRVPIADTSDAINKVLDEAAANVEEGTIDLIWLNGENFRTLKDAELLYGPWSESIPKATIS